jgi:hypothetical protein
MVVKIIGKCTLLLAIVFLIVEATIFFSPFKEKDLETDFAAAIIDKQQILNATPSPKIVLIGGSSVAYGIDSQLMQDSLGIPVINMSFQYFLGSDFLFQQLLGSLNKGDKIISSFEYIVTKQGDKKEQLKAASYFPKAYDWIVFETPDEYISAWLRTHIGFFRNIILRLYDQTPFNPIVEDKTNTFFRGAINKNGDLVSHLNNNPVAFADCNTKKDSVYYPVISNINYYTNTLKKNDIDVYFTFPPYEENSFRNDKRLVDSLVVEFNKYPNINLLDSPYDNIYPNSFFQDMCYHLNAKGRKERTLKLIKDLKNTLAANAL